VTVNQGVSGSSPEGRAKEITAMWSLFLCPDFWGLEIQGATWKVVED